MSVVIRASERPLGASNRPDWCTVTSAGLFRISANGLARFDRHSHECNEYWLIFNGKAKIMVGGRDYYVKSGDIVCTKAGDEHDVLEIYESIEAFWFEEAIPPGGKTGHQHKVPEQAAGHIVPAEDLPEDFPE